MNEIALNKMRDMEDALMAAIKGRMREVSGNYAVTPNTMKAAEILVALFKIEQQIGDIPERKEEKEETKNPEQDIWKLINEVDPPTLTENKHRICEALGETLKLTRAGESIDDLIYLHESETVKIVFRNGYAKYVSVEADSGIAMIRDVLRDL